MMDFKFSKNDLFNNITNSIDDPPSHFDVLYKNIWSDLHDQSSVFRYKLNVKSERILPGKYNFLLQLNEDRATNRRLPENIQDVNQKFDDKKFNFNKVSEDEIMLNFLIDGDFSKNRLLVNTSPICFGHSLLCPNIDECLPQVMTMKSLELISYIMFISTDKNLRAGFNSLCGMASVNHLHYHLLILNYRLPVESVECKHLKGPLYELNEHYPAKGFCYQIKSKHEISNICSEIYKLISFLMENNIAHNLYLTKGIDYDGSAENVLRIFLWVRTSSYGAKKVSGYNLAICEFSGQFPIKNKTDYETLTEDYVVKTLEETTDPVFSSIKEWVIALY